MIVDDEAIKDLALFWDKLLKCNLRFLKLINSEGVLSFVPLNYNNIIFKEDKFKINTKFYENKCVLVSGAGGSIGSQISRELSKKNNATSVENDGQEANMLCVTFNKTSDRISFQNEYSSKAENFMKNGQNSVVMHPTWEDVTLLQKNNSEENKKSSKYGY